MMLARQAKTLGGRSSTNDRVTRARTKLPLQLHQPLPGPLLEKYCSKSCKACLFHFEYETGCTSFFRSGEKLMEIIGIACRLAYR